eukprot:CAMPEP_0202910806 /NCGR_PEP_ID=MMETSP1392-20130828/53072_1 /ASSEMBLY_ACC=CAM_ASM_000868 /TAXON_ID=225041 /ORGANISM="Chlamydomonas chlamydogama, Strain SAG 11-48b" /LENGTH=347 /DNA_ID=CAMNT_0049601049 /DNA_START=27 /DNA_END=1067 /DNA_ORIENTATION=-
MLSWLKNTPVLKSTVNKAVPAHSIGNVADQLAAPTNQQAEACKERDVEFVLKEPRVRDGPGIVQRAFPSKQWDYMDPFLLFDEFGPKVLAPFEMRRTDHLGQHPHRGFETISYFVEGGVDHFSTDGKHGSLRKGDVQLMTAGAGVVHGFIPLQELEKQGGPVHGYQIWLNLPAAERMSKPRAVDFKASETPVVSSEDGKVRVRVLAGEALGASCSLMPSAVPITMLHYTLQPGATVTQPITPGYNVMLHVARGSALVGPRKQAVGASHAALFKRDAGSHITFSCPDSAEEEVDLLVLGGQPTGEPVVQRGPFVGSIPADIDAAWADFNAGLFGHLAPDGSSQPKSKW